MWFSVVNTMELPGPSIGARRIFINWCSHVRKDKHLYEKQIKTILRLGATLGHSQYLWPMVVQNDLCETDAIDLWVRYSLKVRCSYVNILRSIFYDQWSYKFSLVCVQLCTQNVLILEIFASELQRKVQRSWLPKCKIIYGPFQAYIDCNRSYNIFFNLCWRRNFFSFIRSKLGQEDFEDCLR